MSLQKYISAFIAAAFFLSCCGCDRQEENTENSFIETFVYEQAGDPHLIAASGDILYALSRNNDHASILSVFDINGNETTSVDLSDCSMYDIECICADDNKVYAAINKTGKFLICFVDIDTGEINPICELDKLDNIEKIGVCDRKLYWIGEHRSEAKTVDSFMTEENVLIHFEDTGKKMGSVDLESGENVFSDIELPVSFSVFNDVVTVYAFDSEGGYYFTDNAKPSAKKYTNKLGSLTNFEFYGNGGEFVFIGANDFQGVLPVSKADSESGVIRAVNNVYPFFSADLCASETGHVWLKTADSALSSEKLIKRYDMSDINISGNPVRIISSQYFTEQPFVTGSEIQKDQLSGEGFALTVLSLDKSYDAAMIGSEQGIANNIKEKGSFYPLNDVPGVSEYLDRCFPYIKEAVTDEDGNICMLPIAVEIPLIAYNEKNCAENDITLSSELEPFLHAIKQASTVSEYYDCGRYQMVQAQLVGYLLNNKSFDTEKFRSIAVLLKEQCTEDIFKGNFELYSALMTVQGGMNDRYYTEIYEKTLFTQLLYRFQQITLVNDNNLRASSMPLSQSGKSVAICTFLCVNPYSDRLTETLSFIENTVTAMSSERNSCMLADPSTYENTTFAQDLYSIYENGEICFQIPSEIYANDFERYCADEITLDEFISEADRKLSAYLNE